MSYFGSIHSHLGMIMSIHRRFNDMVTHINEALNKDLNSQRVVKTPTLQILLEQYRESRLEIIRGCIRHINATLADNKLSEDEAIMVVKDFLYLINVGDSRGSSTLFQSGMSAIEDNSPWSRLKSFVSDGMTKTRATYIGASATTRGIKSLREISQTAEAIKIKATGEPVVTI